MDDNSLISAIDNHNVANGDESWFSRRLDATGEFAGDVGEALTKGSVGAVVAGVNSFINTGIAVANFVGAEFEPASTYDTLKELDDDLAKYYREHEAGVETAGFLVGSFIPGMAGIKALQAAKAGFIGDNMARSTGLMTSLTRDYAKAAKIEFAAKNSPFSILNANTVKALSQGLGSSALDMLAFETAVTATMYKSPLLDFDSANDIFWDIATGVAIGGGLGAVLHGTKLGYDIIKAGKTVDIELFPYKHIEVPPETATHDIKLINLFAQKFRMPEPELLAGAKTDLDPVARLKLINESRDKTLERIDILIQKELTDMAGGDAKVSQQMFNVLKESRDLNDIAGALMHTRNLTRITESEALEVGDVIFPQHKMPIDKFEILQKGGDFSKLFTNAATAETKGFRVIGNIQDLKVVNYSRELTSREEAFLKNYDVFRNANGTFSVNPASKILEFSESRRIANNRIIDFETGSAVNKATAGIADFATKENPLKVNGGIVSFGNQEPIKIGDTLKFNPTEGSHIDVQARYIWTQEQKNIQWKGKIIGEDDLPLLERAYYDGNKSDGFFIKTADGKVSLAPTGERLSQFIQSKKYEFAQKLNGTAIDEIGYRLNVSDKWLQGEADELAKLRPGIDYQNPRYGRVDYDPAANAAKLYNANQLDGMINYEINKSLIELRHEQNFGVFAQELTGDFPPPPKWNDPGRTPTREGAGASAVGFANANYGTAAGWAQVTGIATNRLKTFRKTAVAETLNPLMASVVQDGSKATTELALLENTLRSSPEAWVQHPLKPRTLIPKKDFTQAIKGNKTSEELVIENESVWELGQARAKINSDNQVHVKNLKGASGVMGDANDPTVWYPIPLNTSTYKHFVFVEPREIALADKTRMIVAKDEATLEKLAAQVDKNKFNVWTKQEKEEYYKAKGSYDFSLGLNESAVDSSLKRKGVMGEFFPTVSPDRVMQDILDWHMRQEEILVTRMVEHRYSQAFQELELLGKDYTNLATSQFRSLTEKLESGVKDPYNEIVKTALDISTGTESRYQWWRSFNDTIKDAIEVPINKMREIFKNAPEVTTTELAEINRISDRMGMGRPFETAYQANVANGNIADKPWLARGISDAQGIMSASLLQLDFFNAANNYISSSILTSAEMNNLIRGIMAGDEQVAGKLALLGKVKLPDGSNLEIPTKAKLWHAAIENEINDDGKLFARYRKIGAVTDDIWNDKKQMLSNLTFDYKNITPSEMNRKISDAVKLGRKWTGNQLAESSSRFYAADIMRQITNLAIESGVLKNLDEANEYIQLFTNRTQGNYLHSQRPIVFQGVVGQAISLFQTYQFNLMQQMFRYVGEGDKKSIAVLLGLQNTIYGMQGLPAFNFLNTHIVGNASGNTEHKDLFQASYSVFGKELGDWMLYGLGSNALGLVDPSMKFNLYSRGDINPRQLTVLPTTLSDIPVVNASVKFVKNLYQFADRIGSGGSAWPALSQALEHNGLSRPLAGLAQVAQGYTTTSQASLLTSSQDFWNIATLSRIAGGKPFDEAIALDALYRINAYKAKDTSNIQDLGAAIKTTMVGGGIPTQEQVEGFAKSYAKSGGRIENFNKFFTNAMMTANQSQVNRVAEHLRSPFSKQMQVIMGGVPLKDFLNEPAE